MTPPKSLTCQGCSKGFISKDQFKKRCPVLLDCGHSVCEECVRSAASKSPLLPCPHCQQLTLVQEKTLPPDAFINGCLVLNVKPRINEDSLTFVAQKKAKNVLPDKLLRPLIPEKEKCEECAVNFGSLMCAKCEDTRFCEACFFKIHRSSKLLSRHVSRPVPPSPAAMAAVAPPVGDGGAALPESRCCTLHGDRPLEYYCTDDNVAVCSHCSISGEHKGHTVEPLSDRNARRRPELEQAVQRARNTLLRLRWAAKSVQTAAPSQFLDPAELQETIRGYFCQLHGQLQLRQLALTEQLLSAAQTQRAALRDTELAVEESCGLLRRLLSQAESALTGGEGAATLDMEPLLQQLGAAADRPCHLTWAETDDDASQVRFLADKELLTSIGEHGKLEVDIQPPVRLLAETDLPLDHVVKDITPEMLAEEEPVRDTVSVVSSAAGSSSVEVLGVAASRPMPPPPRLSSSPRPPSERRLAAVFPARPPPPMPPPPAADGAAAATDGRQATAAAANSSLGPFGQEQVQVTHIKSPSQFYVQCCSQERQLQELMRRVAQWCRNPESKRNKHLLTLTKNELCLSKYADGRWYRARILDVYPPSEEGAPSEYEVFYVDYGNQEQVVESRLLPITGALAREHDMALPCTLWDLLPAGGAAIWSQQATHAFAGLVRGEPVAMTTISSKPGRLREVELLKMPNQNIEGDSAQSVRDHLVFIGLANYVGGVGSKRTRAAPVSGVAAGSGRPPALPSSVTITRMESASSDRRHFYAPERLLKGSQTDVLVSHVDSPETFYIQQLGVHAEYLSNMMDEMQRVYTKSTRHALLNPQKGQVCISQFSVDGKFYRAEIEVLLSHGMLDVYYVDYGNRERVSLQAVRKIEDKFMVISKQALKCRLADIQPSDPKSGWQDTVRQHFIEATDNCVLKMYVDSVDSISHVVTLYKCGRDADICINALLAQLSCVRGGAPSTRVVEYSKVGWEPSREIRSTGGASSTGSGPPSVTRLPASSPSASTSAAQPQALPGDAAHVAAGTRSLEVSVCHCASPAKFSVQIRDEILNLDRMMRELQEQYGGAATPSSHGYTWRVDDVAVARCRNLDQRFYRVRVLFVSEAESDKAQVLLIDYGTTVTVQQRDIAVMRKRFEEHRAFALTCQLHGIRPAGDRGVWTGVAIDFFKNMIEKSKKLFLIPKMPMGGERTTQLSSLPCDLEAEEHKTVSALEPTRRIRTSLAGKLVEQGLAFSNSRTADLSEQCPVSAESASLAASMQWAVRGTRPPGADSEAGGPASEAERRSVPPSASGSVGNTDGLAAQAAESEANSQEGGEDLTISCEEDQEIPLGADWATLRSAAAASDPSAPEGDDGGCVTPPDQPGRLELIMLEAEQAAELVQQRSAEDWLPATVPAENILKAIPTHVTMAGSIYLHTFPRGKETLDVIKQALKTQFDGSQPRPCDSYWFDGQACIAKYYLDEGWYRAKVLQVHKGKVTVQFVDYGNTDRVSPSELRKNIIMEYVPIQALLCELHNIVPLAEDGNYTVKALNFLHSQIVERECHLEIHHFNAVNRRFLVSLRLAQSGLDVGELLVKMGDARYMTDEELAAAEAGASDPLLDALLRNSPYPRLQLPAGVLLPVTVAALLSPALLLVQPQRVAGEPSAPLRLLAQHLEAIDDLRERMTEEAETQLMLADPTVGSACLSLFSDDQSWYRAVITGRDGDNANVQYVDWGNNETVKVDSLREIPAPLRSLPAWTLLVELCRLAPADASGWSPEAVTAMQECLFKPDVQLWARVKQSLREPPLIELVVIDDPTAADSKTRLAYQPVVDRGLVVLSAPTHRN